MVSVIIPLYNKENLIIETINTVLNQTYSDFELIIVNDGSTDNSVSQVKKINDDRLHVISIENSGVSVARNRGINAAKYEWVALLDGDDWWAPSFLEEMVMAINDYPEYKLFASGRSRVFNTLTERYEHNLLPKEGNTQPINYFKVLATELPLINSSSVIIDKKLFGFAGYFRPQQKKHEDHDLWMRLAINQEVVFVNKNLSFYRKTEIDTASLASFRPVDFYAFIDTMIEVKELITLDELIYFKRYYNKFALLVYLQYYGSFSQEEDKLLLSQISRLLSGKHFFLIRLIHFLPLKWFYRWFKNFKKKWKR